MQPQELKKDLFREILEPCSPYSVARMGRSVIRDLRWHKPRIALRSIRATVLDKTQAQEVREILFRAEFQDDVT
jgi:predicted NAD-dependent protein-ADP-ribosyltransferase YbiA (DUF1768 family)